MSTKVLSYSTIPLDSIEVSSNEKGFDATTVLDNNLETFWKPALMQQSFLRVNFLKPHLAKGYDIAFNKGDSRRYVFETSFLDTDNRTWKSMGVYETKGTTNEPIRINIPDVITKSLRVTFLSHTDTKTGQVGIIPEVSEFRVYGEVTEDEYKGAGTVPSNLPCPEGYTREEGTGTCVKNVKFEFLKPSEIVAQPAQSTNDDINNIVNDDTKNSYTLKGKDSKIIQRFSNEVQINSIDLLIENPNKSEYNFLVNIPNRAQVPVTMQGDLSQMSIPINESVTSNSIEFWMVGTTDPNAALKIVKMNVLGDLNPVMHACGPDEHWDDTQGKCVKNVIEHNCAADEHWDDTQGKCVKNEIPTDTNINTVGVKIMRPIKKGGQEQTKFTVARSVTNQSSEKNILRDSIYGDPKLVTFDAVNIALAGYVNFSLTKPDQGDWKLRGGPHNSDNPKAGQCYACGFQINPDSPSGPFFAKEYPQHSTTPKFTDRVKLTGLKLPDLNGKTFGTQVICWNTPQNTVKLECYVDLSVLDKSIDELRKGKPPNNWQLYWTAEDKGDLVGKPHLVNKGLENDDKAMFIYHRIDHVTGDKNTPTTKAAFVGTTEIVPPV